MNTVEVIEIGQNALWTLLMISAPIMGVSLVVGLSIALFQALTQIQEMTLTFVPKIVAIFLTLALALPFMFNTMKDFTVELYGKIALTEQETIEESAEE